MCQISPRPHHHGQRKHCKPRRRFQREPRPPSPLAPVARAVQGFRRHNDRATPALGSGAGARELPAPGLQAWDEALLPSTRPWDKETGAAFVETLSRALPLIGRQAHTPPPSRPQPLTGAVPSREPGGEFSFCSPTGKVLQRLREWEHRHLRSGEAFRHNECLVLGQQFFMLHYSVWGDGCPGSWGRSPPGHPPSRYGMSEFLLLWQVWFAKGALFLLLDTAPAEIDFSPSRRDPSSGGNCQDAPCA